MDENQARERIKEFTDPRIDEVGLLLLNFGMEFIGGGDETEIRRGSDIVGHIDLIFKSKKTKKYFFIEVSVQKNERAPKINGFFRRWEDMRNKEEIKSRAL